MELQFGSVGFEERGKPEYPEKNLSEKRTNNKRNPCTYGVDVGIRPGPHWWEASALTPAPSLAPLKHNYNDVYTRDKRSFIDTDGTMIS